MVIGSVRIKVRVKKAAVGYLLMREVIVFIVKSPFVLPIFFSYI